MMSNIFSPLCFSVLTIYSITGCQNSLQCYEFKEFQESAYSGLVWSKFIDPENHRAKTITLNKDELSVIYPMDTSGFFSFVKIKDSIIKVPYKNYLTVVRNHQERKFYIYFECPNK
jgi:hypothetical protein